MQESTNGTTAPDGEAWVSKSPSRPDDAITTEQFARVYERTANRIMQPISIAALDRVGSIEPGTRLIDIAAGAGALSVPAAERGASVLAIDIAPGMVKLLTERLAQFPGCSAREMDGEALTLESGSFDAAFSIVGVSIFEDFRRGLLEQARVIRPGGVGCLATWRKPPGGGPFQIMAQALRTVFPDRPPPRPPEGFIALADPERMAGEMSAAGFVDVAVEEIDAVWEGNAGQAYLDELQELHEFMGPYAALGDDERRRVDAAILSLVDGLASGGRIALHSPVLLGTGTRADEKTG